MTKISELPAGTTPDGTEKIAAVQHGVTVELTSQQISDLAGGSRTGTGADVRANSPTLITPVLGVATGTSLSLSNTALTKALDVAQTLTGSTGGNYQVNRFRITSDNAATAGGILANVLISDTFGGSTVDGGRQGLQINNIMSSTTNAANAFRVYTAATMVMDVRANDSGTGTGANAKGHAIALNTSALTAAGATFWDSVQSIQADVYTPASSSMAYRAGVTVADEGSAVQGSTWDTAFGASALAATVGFKTGLLFGDMRGFHPIATTGTLIGTTGSATVARGIDFSSYTFTGNQYQGPGVTISNAGYPQFTGGIGLVGGTSGEVFINVATDAGGYNFNVPIVQATAVGQPLISGVSTSFGTAPMTWGAVSYPTSATSGGIPYFSSTTVMASSALLAANALMIGGGAGTAPSTTATGTGVLTALGVNVGSAGAVVTFNGALGTPSSGTVTNLTGTASININGTVGATTPTTGAFTTTVVSTSETTPLVIGGTAASATLTLESTSGAGTTDAIKFKTASQTDRMQITTGGLVHVGPNVTPLALFTVNQNTVAAASASVAPALQVSGADAASPLIIADSYGTSQNPFISLRAARGTAASFTATQSGDALGYFGMVGATAANTFANARTLAGGIYFGGTATENWSGTNQGARIDFYTTTIGTNTINKRMSLADGLMVGSTTDPGIGNIQATGSPLILSATAIPAGGTAGAGYKFSSTSNFGVFFGSGVPSLAAAKGSLYLRSDGSTTNDRAYINTSGSTTWTALTTAA